MPPQSMKKQNTNANIAALNEQYISEDNIFLNLVCSYQIYFKVCFLYNTIFSFS